MAILYTLTCYCGADFEVEPYRKDTAKYCSLKCSGKRVGESKRGQKRPSGLTRKTSTTRSQTLREMWERPGFRERRAESQAKVIAEGRHRHKTIPKHRRQSRMEFQIAPILKSWGYEHNDWFIITHNGVRRLPDFVDRENKRAFEFFGDFWHPVEHEVEYTQWYNEAGWDLMILWEHDLEAFLQGTFQHFGLV